MSKQIIGVSSPNTNNRKINIDVIRTDISEDEVKDNYVSFNQNDSSF